MQTVISYLTSGWAGIAIIVGAVVVAGAALFMVRRSGVQAQQNADLRQQVADTQRASAVDARVSALPPTQVEAELRSKYGRPE